MSCLPFQFAPQIKLNYIFCKLLSKRIQLAFWGELYSYIFFLFKMVGNIEIKPMRKSTDKVLRSYRSLTDFSSPRARPAWQVKIKHHIWDYKNMKEWSVRSHKRHWHCKPQQKMYHLSLGCGARLSWWQLVEKGVRTKKIITSQAS